MRDADLTTGYQLIAELLLGPDHRDMARVDALREDLGAALPTVGGWLAKFFAAPASASRDEYVQTLELSPPCPLYLGAYLFDEPSTCNGVGTSGRNAFMLELSGMYRHFGLDLTRHELPDYLPAMVDFLWISLERPGRDGIGLRRRYVERYVQPGLEPLREALTKYGSPYVLLVTALQSAVEEDVRRMGDAPAWEPPPDPSAPVVSLPVLTSDAGDADERTSVREPHGGSALSRATPDHAIAVEGGSARGQGWM